MKNLPIILIAFFSIFSLILSFFNYSLLSDIEERLIQVEQSVAVTVGEVTNLEDKFPIDEGYETFVGTLVKEKIPPELELGAYWYWIYFDEPYLLEENAAGFPMNVTKLQINPPAREELGMDVFDGNHVEIIGYLTWGYAESTVIQAEEIIIN